MLISSSLKSIDLVQTPPPLIIGERLNTQGSRQAKNYVLNNDFDGLLNLAKKQVEDGSHCLDVCVATTERSDELSFMTKLIKQLSLEIDAPLSIDSTDPNVIAAVLEQIPGKPIINSINLEGNGNRFHKIAPLMVKYGVPAISLCIGPNGMAKSPLEKLNTAKLLFQTGKRYNLKSDQFIFDVLTFTLATGQKEFINSGKYTLEGIKLVKQAFPSSFTTLGLSNISFGLSHNARKILNSVFLQHALQYGLDTVIICAKDIVPYGQLDRKEIQLAENLIFNKHANSLSEFVTYFDNKSPATSHIQTKQIDQILDPGKKLSFKIINRLKDGIENDVILTITNKLHQNKLTKNSINLQNVDKKLLHDSALQTLNDNLLPAMKEVGDKFGSGELILPFVLKSAECMKSAVTELEKYLIKKDNNKGKIVLGTVYGDVHDIGKNLVKTIFENNGYTVYDLGKQVPLQTFIDKINEVNANAVGLSALLVSTSKQMQYFVEYAKKNNLNIPIICGGAAINSNYINRIAKNDGIYNSGVFYCKTMFDGLKIIDKLTSDQKNIFLQQWNTKIKNWQDDIVVKQDNTQHHNSMVKAISPPIPHIIDQPIKLNYNQINLNEIWNYLNKKSLFVLSWGLRGKSVKNLRIQHEKLLDEWKNKIITDKLFEPSIIYGHFRCHNDGNDLIVDHHDKQIIFNFPRSTKNKHLCITDYFGKNDLVSFQLVTVGTKVSKIIEKWNNENKYTDAYYLHGLAVESVEAMAEWINNKIRQELKIIHGLRYSWGYPSCPDIMQHFLVWKLLEPDKPNLALTDMGQIIPDHSTAAIFIHHPEAEYFTL